MRSFFKVKISSVFIFLALSLVPFVFIAIFSGEGIRVASDNTIGMEIKRQIVADDLLSEIISAKNLRFGSVRSVSLPGPNPGKAEFSVGASGVLVVQYRGLKEPYEIKKITLIQSGAAEVIFND